VVPTPARLKRMCVTNAIPLGCSLLLQVGAVNCVQTLQGPFAPRTGDWGKPIVVTKGEDSFLWRDKRGHFHLIYHTGGAIGGHAYSRDAWSWTQSTGPPAYTATVDHHAGQTTYASRQRPALVMNGDGQPVALVTGVAGRGHVGVGRDKTFTHLQKLRLGQPL
jgi:hypothetical protein